MLRDIGAGVASPPRVHGVSADWRDRVLIALVRAVCVLGAIPVAQAAWSDYTLGFHGLLAWNLGAFTLLASGAFLPRLAPVTRLWIVLCALAAYVVLAIGSQGLSLTAGVVAVAAIGAAQLGLGGRAALVTWTVVLAVLVVRAWFGEMPGLPSLDRGDGQASGRFARTVIVYVAVIGGLAMAVQTVLGRLERGLAENRRVATEIRERSEARGALARQVERVQGAERERLVGALYDDLGRRLHDLHDSALAAAAAVDQPAQQASLTEAERVADELAERVRLVSRRLAG